MTAPRPMTVQQVADGSGRNPYSVREALRRQLLKGAQAHAGAKWLIQSEAFQDWVERGAPIDHPPARRRLRRSA